MGDSFAYDPDHTPFDVAADESSDPDAVLWKLWFPPALLGDGSHEYLLRIRDISRITVFVARHEFTTAAGEVTRAEVYSPFVIAPAAFLPIAQVDYLCDATIGATPSTPPTPDSLDGADGTGEVYALVSDGLPVVPGGVAAVRGEALSLVRTTDHLGVAHLHTDGTIRHAPQSDSRIWTGFFTFEPVAFDSDQYGAAVQTELVEAGVLLETALFPYGGDVPFTSRAAWWNGWSGRRAQLLAWHGPGGSWPGYWAGILDDLWGAAGTSTDPSPLWYGKAIADGWFCDAIAQTFDWARSSGLLDRCLWITPKDEITSAFGGDPTAVAWAAPAGGMSAIFTTMRDHGCPPINQGLTASPGAYRGYSRSYTGWKGDTYCDLVDQYHAPDQAGPPEARFGLTPFAVRNAMRWAARQRVIAKPRTGLIHVHWSAYKRASYGGVPFEGQYWDMVTPADPFPAASMWRQVVFGAACLRLYRPDAYSAVATRAAATAGAGLEMGLRPGSIQWTECLAAAKRIAQLSPRLLGTELAPPHPGLDFDACYRDGVFGKIWVAVNGLTVAATLPEAAVPTGASWTAAEQWVGVRQTVLLPGAVPGMTVPAGGVVILRGS